MKTTLSRMARGLLALALPLLLAVPAGAVLVSIGEYSGTVGDTLDVTIDTEDLTGLGVYSWEVDVRWTGTTYLTLIDVVETGSLGDAAGWGAPLWSVGGTGNTARIAAAGAGTLSGAGTLVTMRFELGPQSGTPTLYLDSALFNEGTPSTTTDNGWVSIAPAPTITVSPDTGEIMTGDTLAFGVSGGVGPYTWGTTDAGIATIDGSGLLTALSFGPVRVWAEDSNGVRDTTNVVDVRAMTLSALDGLSGPPGSSFMVPVLVTDVSGLGVTSWQFSLSYNASRVVATGITMAGTITNTAGWGTPQYSIEDGQILIAAAGATPLSGAGPLVLVNMTVPLGATSSTPLTLGDALLAEQYVPLLDHGSFSVISPGAIFVSPNTASVLIGTTQQFTVSGSPFPPLTWSTTDPAVGTIDATGLFTPVAGGQCQVVAQDWLGAIDSTSTIDVFDFSIRVPDTVVQTAIPTTVVPITVDRDLGPLAVWGYEITLSFNGNIVNAIAATDSGSISSSWGTPTYHVYPDSIKIAHAGSGPLTGGPGTLLNLYFQPDPGATPGQTTAFTFRHVLFNEGHPRAAPLDGTLRVDDTMTGVVDPLAASGLQLAQNRPNPVRDGVTTIRFSVSRAIAGAAALTILDPSGRVVKSWNLGEVDRGPQSITWDGRDARGSHVASGVYFYRLAGGGEEQVKKLVVLR